MKKIVHGFFLMAVMVLSSPVGVSAEELNIDNIEAKFNETAAQVSSTLDTAKNLIRVATTTAGVAKDAYDKGEKAVSATAEVVRRGSAVYENIKPIVQKIGDTWNWITNNNEFWRVALVVSVGIILWIIIRYTI